MHPIIKGGLKEYWIFIAPAAAILYYFYHNATSNKVLTNPILNVTPGGVDAGQVQNIARSVGVLYGRQQVAQGYQTSKSLNPTPNTTFTFGGLGS